jgi:uncharacterized protein
MTGCRAAGAVPPPGPPSATRRELGGAVRAGSSPSGCEAGTVEPSRVVTERPRSGCLTGNTVRALTVMLLLVAGVAGAREVPYLSGRVNDEAGIIPTDARQRIETELAAFEKETGAQIAVLTIDSLEGENLEDYSLRVAQTWGLGREGRDDGVLFLVARNDRKMRLEVGYGLEPRLTDARCGRILDRVARPEFRAGRFGAGIEKTVDAVVATLEGRDVVPDAPPARRNDIASAPLIARLGGLLIFTVVVGVFSLVALFGKGCMGWFLYAFLMPFYLLFPAGLIHPAAGAIAFGSWLIGFPILKLFFARSGAGKAFLAAHPNLVQFSTSTGRSGSGGSWSSGGFSGGGGSFGGGGASSSW